MTMKAVKVEARKTGDGRSDHNSGRSIKPTHGNQTIEYGELRVDLSAERLMWNGQGMERARELIQKRVDEMRRQGWELAGSIRDPGVLQQGQSLRGVTIRSAVLFLRRVSQ